MLEQEDWSYCLKGWKIFEVIVDGTAKRKGWVNISGDVSLISITSLV